MLHREQAGWVIKKIMDLLTSISQFFSYWIWGAPPFKLLFGTAGLQRWNVEKVREVFKALEAGGIKDLDTAHIYVSTTFLLSYL